MQRIDNKLEDWRREDKKTIPGEATYVKSIIGAATVLLIFFPVSLLILIPLALVYHGAKAAIRLAQGKPAIEKASWPPKAVLKPLNLDKTRIPLDERRYDIVLFGVTGFTGALATKYVARKYGNSVKWAIAGRRKEALEKIRDDLIKINSELKDLPLIVANSDDPSSLDEMVKDTRVIITTVGPYAVYGTELVKAAIENGTSYCDLTGEPQWCDVLIDKYDAAARKTGARIVNMAGHDCVPWDLLALKCAEYLKEKGDGEELVEVSFFDEARSTPSGGTLATVLESFPRKVYQSSTGFSPYEMDAEGNRSPYKTINEINFKPGYTEEFGKYSSFFIMSAVIYKCVQRSNALNGYGHRLVYKELEVVPNLPTLISKYLRLPVLGAILALPPLRERLLPKPGEGASESQLKNGFLQVTCIAKGNKGTQLLARIYFDVDPGYQDTARMIVESGLAMALNRDKLKCGPDGGGVLTPASCQGSVLLDRLVDTGSKFCIKEI